MSQTLTTTSYRTSNPLKPYTDPYPMPSTKHTKKGSKPKKSGATKTPPAKVPSNTVRVGVWDLKSHEFAELTPPEDTESLFNGVPSESVIGGDGRKAIPKKHIMPGGKYRAIVKLFLRFAGQPEGSSWAMATGWLIENDLIVTAGHCAYDWSHKYGRLTHVKAYIGYSGKDSVKDKSVVQLRMGIRVASTEGWLSKGSTDPRGDVALIRVNKPFTGVTPIKYAPTPLSGSNVRLGVVGYPGDLMKKATKEKGALMHEMFLPTNYTLDGSKSKMLQYAIDTYGGNSGSPVLRKSDMTSIGVHVLGGNPNSGSVIAGKYGNSIDALKYAIKLKSSGVGSNGIGWVPVPKSNTSGGKVVPVPYNGNPTGRTPRGTESGFEATGATEGDQQQVTNSDQQQAEGDQFKSAMKKAMEATTDPLGAIAAYGLHLTSMRVKELNDQEKASGEDAEADTDEAADEAEGAEDEDAVEAADEATDEAADEDESASQEGEDGDEFGEDEADIAEAAEAAAPAYEGVMERALLTDAAFTTMVQLGADKCDKLGYINYIRPYVAKYGRQTSRAGTVIFPHFMAPIFRTTVAKYKMQGEADVDPLGPIAVEDPTTTDFGPRLDAKKEAIIEAFTQGITESLDVIGDTELSDIISKGLRLPGRIVADVAEADLETVFTEALESTTLDGGNEGAFEAALEDTNSSEYFYDALSQRALIGEAMLEAIMNTPVEVQQQEGIFSSIGNALKKAKDAIAAATKSPLLGGIASWATLASTGYMVGKMVYDAAKKKKGKKELNEGEDEGSEAGMDGDSEATVTDGWEAFFS